MSQTPPLARDAAEMIVRKLITDIWWCTTEEYQAFPIERMTPTVEAGVEVGLVLHTQQVLTPSVN